MFKFTWEYVTRNWYKICTAALLGRPGYGLQMQCFLSRTQSESDLGPFWPKRTKCWSWTRAGAGSELVQPTTQFAFARTNFGGLRLLFFKCCSWFCMHVLAPKHDKTSDHLWMSQNTLSWLCFLKKMVVMSSFIWSLDAIIPPAAYDVSKSLV